MRTRPIVPLLTVLLALTLFLDAAAGAQVSLPPAPPPQLQQPRPEEPPQDTLAINVDEVSLYCNVKDKRGALIPNLTLADFEIYEDGQKQSIKHFSAESDQPLTLGLLIDSSYSQQRVLGMEQEVGSAFMAEVLRSRDEAFLISFDINVELLQDFTSSARDLRRALERVRINAGTAGGSVGVGQGPVNISRPRGTLLYDAIYLAADEKLAREVGRKAMIILTDGQDEGSQMKIQQAIEAAQRADAIVYVLLIADRKFYGGEPYSGDSQMRKLTEETGGRMIEVGNKQEKLKEAFDQIAAELRTQYLLGYISTNRSRDGSFRKVEVHNKQGDRVQTRRGYYATSR